MKWNNFVKLVISNSGGRARLFEFWDYLLLIALMVMRVLKGLEFKLASE